MSSDNTDRIMNAPARPLVALDPATLSPTIPTAAERLRPSPGGSIVLPRNKVAYNSEELFRWQRDPATHSAALAELFRMLLEGLRILGENVELLTDTRFVINFSSPAGSSGQRYVFKVRIPDLAQKVEIWQTVDAETLSTRWSMIYDQTTYRLDGTAQAQPRPVRAAASTRDTERTRVVTLD